MDWTEEEEKKFVALWERGAGWPQFAALAVELAAARGGAMTAEGLSRALANLRNLNKTPADAVAEHISAIGARNAVLEAELLKSRRDEWAAREDGMGLRELLSAAEEGNRELVRRGQQAESERDKWKMEAETWGLRVKRAAEELADIGAGEVGRLDIVTRVRMLKARCATLAAAGQVPSERETRMPSLAHPHFGSCQYSLTCTHDDAAKPGHPERVKERSEAFIRSVGTYDPMSATAYEQGAEAMRAACWESVQKKLQEMGMMDTNVSTEMKIAIEGAAP